jgi:predicted nucleic acid-binding protein
VIVLDASVFADLVTGFGRADEYRPYAAADPHWAVPEHFRVEVASALRGAWLGGKLDRPAFEEGIRRLAAAPVEVWPVRPLLPRMVELAGNATVYDAAYLALAEALSVALLTADAKLAGVPGVRCSFITVSGRRAAN